MIKNKILVNKEKPDLTINSPVITFSLQPKPQTPLENPFLIEFKRMKVSGMVETKRSNSHTKRLSPLRSWV